MPWNGTNAELWSCPGGVPGTEYLTSNSGVAINRCISLG
jgi:hypothetical protein